VVSEVWYEIVISRLKLGEMLILKIEKYLLYSVLHCILSQIILLFSSLGRGAAGAETRPPKNRVILNKFSFILEILPK